MYWPDTNTGVDIEPARKPVASAVRKFFTEGGAGQVPTVPGGDWFNQITNEVLNVVGAAGIEPSKIDDDQLLQAILQVSDSGLRHDLASDAGADLIFHKSSITNAVAQALADILNLQPITPEMFGADGSVAGDTAAIKSALAFALITPCKISLSRMYLINEHLTCYYVQTHNSAIAIEGQHRGAGICIVSDVPYAIDIHGYRINIKNVNVEWAATTASATTAIRVCGEQTIVDGVVGKGALGKLVLGVASIRSVFNNIMLNAGSIDHGVAVQLMSSVNCNVGSITVTDCYCPVSFGALPYSPETSNSLKPPSLIETINWGNEGLGCTLLKSVKTTIGPVMSGLELVMSDSVCDLTKEKPIFVGGLFVKFSNCWFQPNSTFTLVDAVGYTAPIGHLSFVACTFAGTSSVSVNYNISADYLQMIGNVVYKATATIAGGGDRFLSGNIPGVDGVINKSAPSAGSVDIMTGSKKSLLASGLILGKDTPDGDGKLQIRANSGERLFNGLTASGPILSTCPGGLAVNTISPSSSAVLFVGAMSGTGRSINAVGTINASGADYAEYMRKENGCGTIEKGRVVGINKDGDITDRFDSSISFAIKSTDPCMVGGAIPGWDADYPDLPSVIEPTPPAQITRKYGCSDAEYASLVSEQIAAYEADVDAYQSAMSAYHHAMDSWRAGYDAAREPYDRIAFSGRVPCYAVGEPGDYVIPSRNDDGSIGAICTASPSFEQYRSSVGRVLSVLDSGIVFVCVKCG